MKIQHAMQQAASRERLQGARTERQGRERSQVQRERAPRPITHRAASRAQSAANGAQHAAPRAQRPQSELRLVGRPALDVAATAPRSAPSANRVRTSLGRRWGYRAGTGSYPGRRAPRLGLGLGLGRR